MCANFFEWLCLSALAELDRRKHRFLDVLFKKLKEQGGTVQEIVRPELIARMSGNPTEFRVREKINQKRRPLTPEEKRTAFFRRDWLRQTIFSGQLPLEMQTDVPQAFIQE